MILTVTMNPAVDISYQVSDLKIDDINRVALNEVKKTAGGKGLNVSRVLRQAGIDVCATGIVGGTTGQLIINQCSDIGIDTQFEEIEAESRNCIAILHDGNQTEILESGAAVSPAVQATFLKRFDQLLEKVDVVAISGSVLPGFSTDLYAQMVERVGVQGKKVILDTSGSQFVTALNHHVKPFAIKPNSSELSELLGREVVDTAESLKLALEDQMFSDIPLILVSRGGNGGFAKVEQSYYEIIIPKIEVVNPVGSGDSTVAGISYSLEHNLSVEEMLRHAMLFGMLNAMENLTGCIDLSKTDQIYSDIKVTKLN